MYKPLRVTPANGADYLRCPPFQVWFRNLSLWRRFDDVPQGPAVCILHHELQGSLRLERTQEMWSPRGIGHQGPDKYITFQLWGTLLAPPIEKKNCNMEREVEDEDAPLALAERCVSLSSSGCTPLNLSGISPHPPQISDKRTNAGRLELINYHSELPHC